MKKFDTRLNSAYADKGYDAAYIKIDLQMLWNFDVHPIQQRTQRQFQKQELKNI